MRVVAHIVRSLLVFVFRPHCTVVVVIVVLAVLLGVCVHVALVSFMIVWCCVVFACGVLFVCFVSVLHSRVLMALLL